MRYLLTVTGLIVAFALVSATADDPPPRPVAAGAAEAAGAAGAAAPPATIELTTLEQRASYAIGYSMGRQFEDDVFEIDMAQLARGFTDGMNGEDAPLTEKQLRRAVQQMSQQIHSNLIERNLAEATAYMDRNAARDGVKVTDSGLQYEVLEPGDGNRPTAEDRVKVHYRGALLDGRVFDSSYKRDEPASFRLDQVIDGWTEGLQLMREGARYRLHIPPELGYGQRGTRNGSIGPNQALIFEVELLEILEPGHRE